VGRQLSEQIDVQEHTIRWETIDLALPWERIEKNLLRMICGADDR
jgi:hypothetical protein